MRQQRKAYKLFRTLPKTKPGKIFPLFIGKTKPTPIGEWIEAEDIPTKGYAHRPGWHSGVLPIAPHLRAKDGYRQQDRVWCEVEIKDFYEFKTSKMQGAKWLISQKIKVNKIMTDEEIWSTLVKAGIPPKEAEKEETWIRA